MNTRSMEDRNRCIDTLFVIGNGFDIWQGLGTSYNEFREYYLTHRDQILKRLHIKKRQIVCSSGKVIELSDVELVYGDPFHPKELDKEFWGNFETSLSEIDTERLNLFFDKDRKGLRAMEKSIRNAKRILTEAFCGWIASLTITKQKSEYDFGSNCVFINFNYTDTLEKRFGVSSNLIYHIHGEASDKKSIIFGHSKHPQLPEPFLYRIGGRYRGLYFVDRLLYETDKHVQDNIQSLCMFLALSGASCESIKNIYILGQSMSLPDLEYFAFLASATSTKENAKKESESASADEEQNALDELFLNLQYTVDRVGYGLDEDEIDEEELKAIERRRISEQEDRSSQYQNLFYKMLKKRQKKKALDMDGDRCLPDKRIEDAKWIISYHGDKSRIWIEKVMETLGCSNYQLYPTIDECIAQYKVCVK